MRRAFLAVVLGAVCMPGCRQDMHDQPKINPQAEARFFPDKRGGRPLIEIAGEDFWRGISEQIEMIGKGRIGAAPSDQLDDLVAAGLRVGLAQARGLGRDCAVGTAAHIG